MFLKNYGILVALKNKFPDFDFVSIHPCGAKSRVVYTNYPLRRSNGSWPTLLELHEQPVESFITGSELVRFQKVLEQKRRVRRHEKRPARRRPGQREVEAERRSSCGWEYT